MSKIEEDSGLSPASTKTFGRSRPPTAECALCDGEGRVFSDGKIHLCVCAVERRIASRLPERYRFADLKDFEDRVLEFCLVWVSRPGDGLCILGPLGTGKTHLAASIFRYVTSLGANAEFKRCAALFSALREAYRINASEETVLEPLERADFLFLDDLGAGSLSDHERRFTLEVLDRRLNANRATVVTSNWNLTEISERMDDRIASRLSSFQQLELSGADRRVFVNSEWPTATRVMQTEEVLPNDGAPDIADEEFLASMRERFREIAGFAVPSKSEPIEIQRTRLMEWLKQHPEAQSR